MSTGNNNGGNNGDFSPPKIDSMFLNLFAVEPYEKGGEKRATFKAYWVVDLPSKENPGSTYTSTIIVDGTLSAKVWAKLKPFADVLFDEREKKSTRVKIRAIGSFLKPPKAYVSNRESSPQAVPVLSLSVYRISHAKRPNEDWVIYDDEKARSAIEREGKKGVKEKLVEAGLVRDHASQPASGSNASGEDYFDDVPF